jgi:hypothetical protein
MWESGPWGWAAHKTWKDRTSDKDNERLIISMGHPFAVDPSA